MVIESNFIIICIKIISDESQERTQTAIHIWMDSFRMIKCLVEFVCIISCKRSIGQTKQKENKKEKRIKMC